jgi:hypothetical protein
MIQFTSWYHSIAYIIIIIIIIIIIKHIEF